MKIFWGVPASIPIAVLQKLPERLPNGVRGSVCHFHFINPASFFVKHDGIHIPTQSAWLFCPDRFFPVLLDQFTVQPLYQQIVTKRRPFGLHRAASCTRPSPRAMTRRKNWPSVLFCQLRKDKPREHVTKKLIFVKFADPIQISCEFVGPQRPIPGGGFERRVLFKPANDSLVLSMVNGRVIAIGRDRCEGASDK